MDPLLLARMQFGITTVYHFFFVPLTLGLGYLVAWLETLYVRTGDEKYKHMTKFWGKLFLINFAVGVVTGIVQEFQFGMNWSEYSRFVGDIFGAPLAIEALLAFFLESTFLGLWIFGWDKLPKKLHAACIWLVAVGSSLSAFWILVAGSFMHEPHGFIIRNGRAEMDNFFDLVFNSHVWLQFGHVISGGFMTAGFFMLGISAWHLLRKPAENRDFFLKSARLATIVSLVGFFAVGVIGHSQGQHLVKSQPMKMAAAEALWHTEDPAAFSLFSIIDEENQTNPFSIQIPAMLSFLSYDRFSGAVLGIKELQERFEAVHGPGNYIPPVTVTFWSFRIMVGLGGIMGLLAAISAWHLWRKGDITPPWFLKTLIVAISFPFVANATGWLLTEMGRQPWIVYGYQKTADAISPNVTVGMLLFSLIAFSSLYGILMAVDIWLLRKFACAGPQTLHANTEQE